VQTTTDKILSLPDGTRVLIAFPLPRSARLSHERVVENLKVLGFVRVLVNDRMIDLDEPFAEHAETLKLDLAGAEELLVIVDRLVIAPDIRSVSRFADNRIHEGDGESSSSMPIHARDYVSATASLPGSPDVRFLDPTPRLFSFNNPYGSPMHGLWGYAGVR
jgi:excinuclease ABC subunit A